MNADLVPIAFPLTPRMQSFIELRDALRTLIQAMRDNSPYAWLAAEKEVADMLLGEGNKKPATPNILSLFHSMSKHFKALANKHPDFEENLIQAVKSLDTQAENIRLAIPGAIDFLQSDAWLTAYTDMIRKQDPLAHKICLPQTIQILWQGERQHAKIVYELVEPIIQAIEHLNQMLHAHVPWENRMAREGSDQITLAAQDDIGLLIVGVPKHAITQGILPNCAGFRSIIRLRFTQWEPGKPSQDVMQNQPYALMAVPIS
ncbi:MAG: hypothetical protein R8M14_02270 [Ghiorsea sp.]